MRTAVKLAVASLLCVAVVAMLAGCGGGGGSNPYGTSGGTGNDGTESGGAPAAGAVVSETGFAFEPSTLDVKVGDTVTFTNEDSAPHNVRIDGKDLGDQAQGASVTWSAEKAGTFPYSCTIHPAMTGEITVK